MATKQIASKLSLTRGESRRKATPPKMAMAINTAAGMRVGLITAVCLRRRRTGRTGEQY